METAEQYIQASIDYKGEFTERGNFEINKPLIINRNDIKIEDANIYTNKPINIFEVGINKQAEIQGFIIDNANFEHRGNENGDYSVIKTVCGNKHQNNIKNGSFKFNYKGNRIANVIDVDFDNMRWASSFTNYDISGYWKNVNIGIKAIKKDPYTYSDGRVFNDVLNTLDVKVKIWGANSYYQMTGIDNSVIDITGQYLYDSKLPIFYLDAQNIILNQMIYDVNQKRAKGIIKADRLTLKGKSTMFGEGFFKVRAMTYSDIEAKEIIIR